MAHYSENREVEARLQRLATARVSLPFETVDYSARDFRRRILRLALGLFTALVLCLGGLLIYFGLVPWIHVSPHVSLHSEGWATLPVIALVIPAAVSLVFYFVLRWHFRHVDDSDGHPWRYRVTATGLTIGRTDGLEAAGPWERWRYDGCSYTQYRGNLATIVGLRLTFDGYPLTIDLTRVRRSLRLTKSLLRHLAR